MKEYLPITGAIITSMLASACLPEQRRIISSTQISFEEADAVLQSHFGEGKNVDFSAVTPGLKVGLSEGQGFQLFSRSDLDSLVTFSKSGLPEQGYAFGRGMVTFIRGSAEEPQPVLVVIKKDEKGGVSAMLGDLDSQRSQESTKVYNLWTIEDGKAVIGDESLFVEYDEKSAQGKLSILNEATGELDFLQNPEGNFQENWQKFFGVGIAYAQENNTPTPTLTFTSTPTPTLTETPRPTATETPEPTPTPDRGYYLDKEGKTVYTKIEAYFEVNGLTQEKVEEMVKEAGGLQASRVSVLDYAVFGEPGMTSEVINRIDSLVLSEPFYLSYKNINVGKRCSIALALAIKTPNNDILRSFIIFGVDGINTYFYENENGAVRSKSVTMENLIVDVKPVGYKLNLNTGQVPDAKLLEAIKRAASINDYPRWILNVLKLWGTSLRRCYDIIQGKSDHKKDICPLGYDIQLNH